MDLIACPSCGRAEVDVIKVAGDAMAALQDRNIPLQVAVLSRPRSLFASEGFGRFLVLTYAAMVQFTWLNYAHHARYWVPYQFWPFGG